MEEQDLDVIRKNIDDIDENLVHLLENRLNLVKEVGKYKLENKLCVYDGNREKNVIEKYKGYLKEHVYDKYIEELCCDIMKVCKDVQQNEVFESKK